MDDLAELFGRSVLIGVSATAVMDGVAWLMFRVFGQPSLDYRVLGRWIGHARRGTFRHPSIVQADEVAGEVIVGRIAHYSIGVFFAGVLLVLQGLDWAEEPTLLPALAVGVGSIVAPLFIMQPAFGLGIAASRTPSPWRSRLGSLRAHTSYALGLFLGALLWSLIV